MCLLTAYLSASRIPARAVREIFPALALLLAKPGGGLDHSLALCHTGLASLVSWFVFVFLEQQCKPGGHFCLVPPFPGFLGSSSENLQEKLERFPKNSG